MALKKMKCLYLFINIMVIFGTSTEYPESNIIIDSSTDSVKSQIGAPILPANRNNSIQYVLYTPENPRESCYFEPDDSNECLFNSSYETKVLIHGFTIKLLPGNFFEQIKDTLLKYDKYNVILVDWTRYNGRPYITAVAKAYLVAIEIGKMLNFLVNTKRVDPSGIHIIGHSLGAHVAGVAGKQVSNLGRVTGLDPAGPLFTKLVKYNRLSDSSAKLVDVIHTSVDLGFHDAIGSIDFYPNGGEKQPACQIGNQYQNADSITSTITSKREMESCCHNIVLTYFMNSIHTCNYLSLECANYDMFAKGRCNNDSNPTNRMGLQCLNIPGLPVGAKFYLNTTDSTPYCENK